MSDKTTSAEVMRLVAHDQAWKEYKKTIRQAREARDKAIAQAEGTFNEAIAQAEGKEVK